MHFMTFRDTFEALFESIFSKNDKSDSLNRSVYASPPLAARATQKRSRAYALCTFLFRHIFAVAGTLRVLLSQPQKRHIPPERYAKEIPEYISIKNPASMQS
jgi:hypothetical protein